MKRGIPGPWYERSDQVQRKKYIRRGDPKSLAEKTSSLRCGIDELTHLPARNNELFFRPRNLNFYQISGGAYFAEERENIP